MPEDLPGDSKNYKKEGVAIRKIKSQLPDPVAGTGKVGTQPGQNDWLKIDVPCIPAYLTLPTILRLSIISTQCPEWDAAWRFR